MYQTIIVPVDPGHIDKLDKTVYAAADLAGYYDARVHYVGVTAAPAYPCLSYDSRYIDNTAVTRTARRA